MFTRRGKLSSFFSRKTRKHFLYLTFPPMRINQFATSQKRTGSGTKVRKNIKMADHAIAVRTGPSIT